LLVVFAACGGSPPPPPPREPPPPRWPGPIAYAAEDAGLDIYVKDSSSTNPRRLTDSPRDEFSPSFYAGRLIAYRMNPPRGDEGDIWLMDATGAHKRNLTRSPGVADWSPAIAPNHPRRIAYMSMASGSPELWLIDLGTGRRTQLTDAGELSEYPSWKSSGRELVFGGTRGGNFEILRISARGGPERNLTNHPARDQWPAWSPDAKRIAFMSDRDGGEDVFVMRADGTGVRNVSRTPSLSESHPAWTPDGRLTFLQHGESGPVHIRVHDGGYDLQIDAVFVYSWARRPA